MAGAESGTETRRSTRRRRSGTRTAAEAEEPVTEALPSSQATGDTSSVPGVSTHGSRATRSSGNATGADSQQPQTPAIPTTVRRSQRRQARQEAEEMPLRTEGDEGADISKQIPMPSRRNRGAAAQPADQTATDPDSAQPAAEQSAAVAPAGAGPTSRQSRRRKATATTAATSPAAAPAVTAAEATPARQGSGAAAVDTSAMESDDDAAEGPTAVQLDNDMLHQLAAGMAAALATQRQPQAGGAGPSGEPEGSETDLSDGSSSEEGDSSDSDQERHSAGGASTATQGLSRAEKGALHWLPQSQLPALDDDEMLDRLEQVARSGLAAQAKQVLAPPQDARRLAREQRKNRPDTAGDGWFDLPATQITPQVKQDLRMLALRGALDPKRFYRNPDATKFPKYFQMGTVVGGPTDFYTGRLTKKERRQTLTEELLADQTLQQAHKRRFAKLQAERSKFKDKRTIAKRKTSNPRLKARRKKPKH